MTWADDVKKAVDAIVELAPVVERVVDTIQTAHADKATNTDEWEIKPITNAAEHEAALNRVQSIMNTEIAKGSPQGRWLDATVDLITAYEKKLFLYGGRNAQK